MNYLIIGIINICLAAIFLSDILCIVTALTRRRISGKVPVNLYTDADSSRTNRLILLVILCLKALIIYLLRNELLGGFRDDKAFLSAGVLIFGLETFSLISACLSRGHKNKKFSAGYILAVPLGLALFGISEILNRMGFDYADPGLFFLGILLCWLITAVIYTITSRVTPAAVLSAVTITGFSLTNYYYSALRNTPLEYFDIRLAGTAASVIGTYSFSIDHLSLAAILSLILIVIISFYFFGLKRADAGKRSLLFGFLSVTALLVFFIAKVPAAKMPSLNASSVSEGYLLHFASVIKMGSIREPSGYSAARAEEILARYDSDAAEAAAASPELPDIIVIMDESFADLPAIYGFETNEDLLPGFHSLRENTVSGRLLTSVYGGGTVMTEYEFLTGNSLYFFPGGTNPFVQYLNEEQQSLASRLKNIGYSATAFHPYLPEDYRRSEGYPLLGFEKFYSIKDDLPYMEKLRSYASDRSDFADIKYLYETRDKEKPFFIFNVTMQNHGLYYTTDESERGIYPLDETLMGDDLLGYFYMIHETDAALTDLLDYFSGVGRNVIVLFFGDHQPTLTVDFGTVSGEEIPADGRYSAEMQYNYSSFIMWANFDIEEEADITTSPNYLRSMLLDQAGIELNAYERFLLDAYAQIPSINSSGHMDADRNWHAGDTPDTELMAEYRYLVYANVFDSEHIASEYFE